MNKRNTKSGFSLISGIEKVSEAVEGYLDDVDKIIRNRKKSDSRKASGNRKNSGNRKASTIGEKARCTRRLPQKVTSSGESDMQETLTKKMEREIHTTYYKEGGFRFFGCNFAQYVNVNLPYEKDFNCMWAAGYNTCLNPMIYLQEKLEAKLEALRAESDVEPLEPENQDLRDMMTEFCDRVHTDKLDLQENWEAEDYRLALQSYCEDLNQRLLNPYHPPED